MAILIDEHTRVLVQGITGREGRARTNLMLNYGTNIVAGTSPGHKGEVVHGVPVFDSVAQAIEEVGQIDASVIFVKGPLVYEAAKEALEAGVKFFLAVADRTPLWDVMKMAALAKRKGANFVGPNTLGICSVGKAILGMIGGSAQSAKEWFKRGPVGVISRSGGITSSIGYYLGKEGIGVTTLVHVGGEPVVGMDIPQVALEFEKDPDTQAIVLFGEIGGTQEERLAELIKEGRITKPVIAYIGGKAAKSGTRFSHAGAIVEGGRGTHEGKVKALKEAGATVVDSFSELPQATRRVLSYHGISIVARPVPDWKTAITDVKPNELRVRGYRIDEMMGKVPFGAMLHLLLRGELPDPKVAQLLEAILVSSVDHGVTPPSALGTMNAASTGASISASIAAGVLAINQHHGGAIEGAMRVFYDGVKRVRQGMDVMDVAAQIRDEFKAKGERVPGFGHRYHTNDPRTKKLLGLLEEAGLDGEYYKLAKAMVEVLSQRKRIPLNVDGAVAVALCELGYDPMVANAFFIISRTAGLAAHFYEERTRFKPMRKITQNWEYDGPKPRNLPEEYK